jgi:arsenate reductase
VTATTAAVALYGIRNCDTVKQARAWLAQAGVGHRFHDYGKHGVPADELARWIGAHGWEALLNRRGTTWRRLDEAARASPVDAASAAVLLRAWPSLIRRPVLTMENQIVVGFDAARYVRLLG